MTGYLFDKKLYPIIDHSDCESREYAMNYEEIAKALNLAGNPGEIMRLLMEENSNEVFCVWLMYKDLEDVFPERKYEPIIRYESPQEVPYRITQASERGFGMFATRAILPGETIVWERPILLKPRAVRWYKKEVDALTKSMVSKLGKSSRNQFFALSSCHSNIPDDVTQQIYSTNSLSVQFSQSEYLYDYSGIFPIISRCNHESVQ